MNTRSLRRSVIALVIATLTSLSAASCSIPTEDRPQPIDRERSTTTVSENP